MVDPFLEQRLASAAALNDPRLAAQKDARLVKSDLDDCSVKQCKAFVELMRYLKDATLAMSSESSPSERLILLQPCSHRVGCGIHQKLNQQLNGIVIELENENNRND